MRIRWNSDRCEVSRCFRQCGLCRGPPRLRPRFEQPGLAKPSEVGGGSTLSARLRTGKRPQGCWPRPSGSSPAPPLRPPLRSSSRLSAALRQARPPARPRPLSRFTPHAPASPSGKGPRPQTLALLFPAGTARCGPFCPGSPSSPRVCACKSGWPVAGVTPCPGATRSLFQGSAAQPRTPRSLPRRRAFLGRATGPPAPGSGSSSRGDAASRRCRRSRWLLGSSSAPGLRLALARRPRAFPSSGVLRFPGTAAGIVRAAPRGSLRA